MNTEIYEIAIDDGWMVWKEGENTNTYLLFLGSSDTFRRYCCLICGSAIMSCFKLKIVIRQRRHSSISFGLFPKCAAEWEMTTSSASNCFHYNIIWIQYSNFLYSPECSRGVFRPTQLWPSRAHQAAFRPEVCIPAWAHGRNGMYWVCAFTVGCVGGGRRAHTKQPLFNNNEEECMA